MRKFDRFGVVEHERRLRNCPLSIIDSRTDFKDGWFTGRANFVSASGDQAYPARNRLSLHHQALRGIP